MFVKSNKKTNKILNETENLILELVEEIRKLLENQNIKIPIKPSVYNGVGSNSSGCTACRARLWAPH